MNIRFTPRTKREILVFFDWCWNNNFEEMIAKVRDRLSISDKELGEWRRKYGKTS